MQLDIWKEILWLIDFLNAMIIVLVILMLLHYRWAKLCVGESRFCSFFLFILGVLPLLLLLLLLLWEIIKNKSFSFVLGFFLVRWRHTWDLGFQSNWHLIELESGFFDIRSCNVGAGDFFTKNLCLFSLRFVYACVFQLIRYILTFAHPSDYLISLLWSTYFWKFLSVRKNLEALNILLSGSSAIFGLIY